MARPPTALTENFYQYDTAKRYQVLRAPGALTSEAERPWWKFEQSS